MPETYQQYQVWVVALGVQNHQTLASGAERAQEGDIVAVRKFVSRSSIGLKEMGRWLWLQVFGRDDNEMSLKGYLLENITNNELGQPEGDPFDKRQYNIPLDRLQDRFPLLDLARVRDIDDFYQPFLPIDEDTGFYLEDSRFSPLDLRGILFNKLTMQVE